MAQTTSTGNWYTNAYAGPFSRQSRLRAPSLIPNSRLSQSTPAPIQQTLVVEAARQNNENKDEKNVARRETIFGPDVGEDEEPGWTEPDEGGKVGVETVKAWVEKAKNEEGLHATTTLQALVNLKRPTLQLQPVNPDDIARDASTPLHNLKFNYDATTPMVSITLSVHPTPSPSTNGKMSMEKERDDVIMIYTGIHEGGFNQSFVLPTEAALDLSSAITATPSQDIDENAIDDKLRPSEDDASDLERGMTNVQISAQPDLAAIPETQSAEPERRRFGIFGRRQAPTDVENQAVEMTEVKEEEKPKEIEKGMRVLIKIEAVGNEGQALQRRNAQLTHILINGMWVPDAGATVPTQGKRVWVIKVVRREAIIGAHTFLLKEIYGLSTSAQPAQTSYPPVADDPYASTPNECIVCLTSPRDVVLLPCRHLVVCRECAVGMVEFGAGGKVGRRDDTPAAPAATTGGEGEDGAAAATTTPVVAATTTTGRERRKKKAKGWFCPVCRQPYTSLLRLALPASSRPLRTPAASRMQSRAPSIYSTHSLRRVPSHAPTLPDGAERMLEGLHPGHHHDDDEDEDDEIEGGPSRPQFVPGEEEDAEAKERRYMAEEEQRERDLETAKKNAITNAGAPKAPDFGLGKEVPVEKDIGEVEHVEVEGSKGTKGWKEV